MLLGPRHVTDRVIDTLDLVRRVVPPGAVGSRQAQVELLLVVRLPGNVERDVADGHNAAAVARNRTRENDGIARRRGGGQDDGVDAPPGRQPPRCLKHSFLNVALWALTADHSGVRAEGKCKVDALGIEVDAEHLASSRLEDLHGEEADQTQSDDRHRFAESHVGLSHALHGDRAHGHEGALVEADLLRQVVARLISRRSAHGEQHAEVLRHPHDLGVTRITPTSARDAVAHPESAVFGCLGHDAR